MRMIAAATAMAMAVAATPLAAIAAQPLPVRFSDRPMGFDGAWLGMSLAQWRAIPPPPQARSRCQAAAGGAASCDYDTRYGTVVLPAAYDLAGAYLARDPHYLFRSGALAEIRFRTSIDAYDPVTAMLTRRFGPATRLVRSQGPTPYGFIQHKVVATWTRPDGVVTLTDPSGRPDQMEIRLARR